MNFKGKSIISLRDLKKDEIEYILKKAYEVKSNQYPDALQGKTLASLFFEPSTRTRLSFDSAISLLGGKYFGIADPSSSSIQKGETLKDSIKTVCGYCDAIVIRHPYEGAARVASEVSSKPIINAGDGANQHPTQTLLDLYTIKEQFGKIDGLNIGLMGDLKYGRTTHSLSMALSYYNVKITLISPKLLRIPIDFKNHLERSGIKFVEASSIEEVGKDLDVLYVTRIQKERFGDLQEYEKVAGSYKINEETMNVLNPKVKIMHPLPRLDEIDPSIDKLENAIYFEQAHNGIPVRQAILGLIMGAIQ
ncbi:MAG: aspartate carbamoyltransferase [Spirochaetes bacterium]|nr:aspartate carbamoyltransferase [Spirochaetota bacterium]